MTQISRSPRTSTRRAQRSEGDLPAEAIKDWELGELVAEGSLARVFRARPSGGSPDRRGAYAVKILLPRWESDHRAVGLIRCEAQVARCVSNPHLVSVLDASVEKPPYYLVMPWLSGATLGRRMTSPPDLPSVLWTIRQTAEALDGLHSAGWMHGDIKPDNIVVSPDGHATLIDLGFARAIEAAASAADRLLLGTANYIAPEALTSQSRSDVRSDIYSLGVVLFQLLCGRLPFQGNSLSELAWQHRQARAPDLLELAPGLPSSLIRLVQEMVARDPFHRPRTCGELVGRLMDLEIATFGEHSAA